jgi:hypothetical protein
VGFELFISDSPATDTTIQTKKITFQRGQRKQAVQRLHVLRPFVGCVVAKRKIYQKTNVRKSVITAAPMYG